MLCAVAQRLRMHNSGEPAPRCGAWYERSVLLSMRDCATTSAITHYCVFIFLSGENEPEDAFLSFRAGQSNGLQCVSQMKFARWRGWFCFVVRLGTLRINQNCYSTDVKVIEAGRRVPP